MSALRGLIGDERKPKEPLSETPAVREAIQSAQKQENFEVSAQKPGEQVSVKARPWPAPRPAEPPPPPKPVKERPSPTPPPTGLDAWADLISFRPPLEVQRTLQKFGPDWEVHKIESAEGPINLDYYPCK
jgi:hypothetical protein